MELREMLELKEKYMKQAREIVDKAEDEGRSMVDRERQAYENFLDQATELKGKIEAERRFIEEQRTAASIEQAKALNKGIALRNTDRIADRLTLSQEEKNLAAEFDMGKALRGMITGNWSNAELERRTMSVGTPSAGGYLIPSPVAALVLDAARNKSVCVGLGAMTVPMTTSTLTMAKVDDDPSVYWRAENEAITEDEDMALGAMAFEAQALGCLVRTSIELIEDAPNAGELIMTAISGALGAELDRVALVGNGTTEPKGLFLTSNVGAVSMGTDGAVLVGYSKFVEAAQKVLEGNGTPSGFVFAPRTWAALENSLSGEGQFIMMPPGLSGMQFKVSNQIPVDQIQGDADNASCIFCGGWENLFFGMRTQVVLEASRVGDTDAFSKMQVLIRGYLRADVQVARPNQFSIVKGIIPSVG